MLLINLGAPAKLKSFVGKRSKQTTYMRETTSSPSWLLLHKVLINWKRRNLRMNEQISKNAVCDAVIPTERSERSESQLSIQQF